MPEGHFTRGIKRLANFIAQFPEWRQLTPEDLQAYVPSFTAGWELPGLCDDLSVRLRILVDVGYPFRPPRIAAFPPPPVLTWPNLEEKGLLCLIGDGALVSVERIESVAMELLAEARDLVNGWHLGTALDRYEDEFQSYWNRWPHNTKKFVSLCAIDGTSRWVSAFFERNFTIVADDEQTLKSWVSNYFTPDSKVTLQSIPLIALPRPPRPAEYPNTVADLYALVGKDTDAFLMLQNLVCTSMVKQKGVLLAFSGRRGYGFAGLILPGTKKGIDKGFRMGHMPPQVLMQRYSAYPVTGASVTRCDPSWVHGRDHNPEVQKLVKKTVVLLGVGSLGSGIAELLAKMGIGKLVLVNPETMLTENASRHSLGVRSMSRRKVTDLALALSKRFPHLLFESHSERWELCYQKNPSIFTSSDLVISTIGSWSAESGLNALIHTSEGFSPVIFGWLEEHAAAGHAVTFFDRKGCLRCMTDDSGFIRVPVTKWPDGGTNKLVPMCGGMFQPYGATELTYAQGLVADLAADVLLERVTSSTHHVWIGQKKLLEPAKGVWHPAWIACHGHPEDGGRIMNIPVTNDDNCSICGKTL